VSLNLYRRHRQGCEGGHAADSRSGEFNERKKGWKRCACVIFVSGTLDRKFARKAAGTADWAEAHRVAETYSKAASWTGRPPQPVVATPPPLEPTRITIEDAVSLYLANREASVAHPTYRKYKTFTKQVVAFADSLGYVMLDQFRPADIDVFYTKSKLGPRSKAKMLDRLRGFFRFAVHRDWIPKSPVSPDLKPPAGSTKAANKLPFTDEQVDDILRACNQFEDRPWANRFGSGIWTGEDMRDFIWILLYTGLRVSDVVLFDMERLRGSEVFLRAKKNGGDVFTYIPDWLRDRLLARAKRYGRKPFLISNARHLDSVIETWREQLYKVFEIADVGEERATPHRFRHTFARILLQRGVPVADVADLLGDDEKTVREHYARWVPERQARLTKILQDAFGDKPKLTAVQGRRVSG
jgi:integrase